MLFSDNSMVASQRTFSQPASVHAPHVTGYLAIITKHFLLPEPQVSLSVLFQVIC